MNSIFRSWRDFFVSLRLTVVLLVFGMVLIFAATLDQVNLGIWAVQEKYFRSFVIYAQAGRFALPVFPGGYVACHPKPLDHFADFVQNRDGPRECPAQRPIDS